MNISKMQALEAKAWALSTTMNSRRKRQREQAATRLRKIRADIEHIVSNQSLPFSTRDNGAHVYHETGKYLILRNHGSSFWTGMRKVAKDFEVIIVGDMNPKRVLTKMQRVG